MINIFDNLVVFGFRNEGYSIRLKYLFEIHPILEEVRNPSGKNTPVVIDITMEKDLGRTL